MPASLNGTRAASTTLVKKPEGKGLGPVCSPLERKAEKRSVSREDRDMEVGVLQVDCCKPIEGTDALKDASLHQHPERELVKGPVQNAQVQDWS